MKWLIGVGFVAAAVAFAGPSLIDRASAAAKSGTQTKAQSVAGRGVTDISARRYYRRYYHAYGYRPYYRPYYARPYLYRPYPYAVPAPFPFGIGFGPFWW